MAFPKTADELDAQGYRFSGMGTCRACGAQIAWYKTPKGKSIPLNQDLEPHWATCPKAQEFRKAQA